MLCSAMFQQNYVNFNLFEHTDINKTVAMPSLCYKGMEQAQGFNCYFYGLQGLDTKDNIILFWSSSSIYNCIMFKKIIQKTYKIKIHYNTSKVIYNSLYVLDDLRWMIRINSSSRIQHPRKLVLCQQTSIRLLEVASLSKLRLQIINMNFMYTQFQLYGLNKVFYL